MRSNRIVFLTLVLVTLGACASVPLDYPKDESYAISAAPDSQLGEIRENWLSVNEGPNGVYPLVGGNDALGARLRLIEQAERSIDAQYFLMKGDEAGRVFAAALLAAADRGVRVRFLLDDVFTSVNDEVLLLLDAHSNIEVRLFNPISRRGFYYLNYIGNFRRANRRMHNKSFTVDGHATIVGGRNIADEYFELKTEGEFLDLDVLGIGPVAEAVGKEFDKFWNSERAIPVEAIEDKLSEAELVAARGAVDAERVATITSVYQKAMQSQLLEQLSSGAVPLYSAPVTVITDTPEKLDLPIARENMQLVNQLTEVVGDAQREVIVFTPYLVPGKEGVESWRRLEERGVRVVLITNSMASNNHLPVHSAYMRYRKDLIRAGVELHEARVDAVEDPIHGGKMTLHTKAMFIDREQTFIGSLNLDPRSIAINTEMGVVIHSPELTERFAERILAVLPEFTYLVELNDNNSLSWRGMIDGVEVVETTEPQVGLWRKLRAWFLRIVPEGQL